MGYPRAQLELLTNISWWQIHYSERSAEEIEAMPLSYNLMVSNLVSEFPNLLMFIPKTLVGISLRKKCISCCKRPWELGRSWKGSGKIGECLYALPARCRFEMKQIGVTRTERKFTESSEKQHWDEGVGQPIRVRERIYQGPEQAFLFNVTGWPPCPPPASLLLSKAWVSLWVQAGIVPAFMLMKAGQRERLPGKQDLSKRTHSRRLKRARALNRRGKNNILQ